MKLFAFIACFFMVSSTMLHEEKLMSELAEMDHDFNMIEKEIVNLHKNAGMTGWWVHGLVYIQVDPEDGGLTVTWFGASAHRPEASGHVANGKGFINFPDHKKEKFTWDGSNHIYWSNGTFWTRDS